jgi:hypothetical protein
MRSHRARPPQVRCDLDTLHSIKLVPSKPKLSSVDFKPLPGGKSVRDSCLLIMPIAYTTLSPAQKAPVSLVRRTESQRALAEF